MSTVIDQIEIAEDVLKEAMRRSGKHDPKAAVLEAVNDYVRPRTQPELIALLGKSDGFFTSEELDAQREIDS